MKIIRLHPGASSSPNPATRSRTPYAIRLAVSTALAFSAQPLYAATCTATNDASLRSCISSTAAGDTINITANITLASPLPAINKNLSFTGNNNTVSGNNAYRVFWVDSGAVSFANLTISGGKAQGGGGTGTVAGGGAGGAGLGGGVFVNGGTVSLSSVAFSGNSATGGNGGSPGGSRGGGGGGMGGNGGGGSGDSAGGGGGLNPGENGSVITAGGSGGAGGSQGVAGAAGGFGGGGGGSGSNPDSTGGGKGGFGGGGGGSGYDGGGPGASGGFGGGGGGGGYNSAGGAGGWGGGAGGSNGVKVNGSGGGGLGAGGAVFAKAGALTFHNVSFASSSATRGVSFVNNGQAKGGAIFICTSTEDATNCSATVNAASCGVTFTGSSAGNAGSTNTDNVNVYNASQSALVAACAPVLDVQGNGVSIANGDTTPSTTDNTDFGSTPAGSPVSKTFSVRNVGTAALSVTTPISLNGAGCGEFSVTTQPGNSVAASSATPFVAQYNPTNAGTDTCTVSIANGDTTQTPYTFLIQGTGTAVTNYTVTPSAGTGGSINPNTAQTVASGGTTQFTVSANTGYTIASVTGCGGSLSGNTYTTGAITGNCAVTASFTAISYTVTPSAWANGSISPNTAQSVNYNATSTFTVNANSGYVASVGGTCGGSLTGATYTTSAITGNCTVAASFAFDRDGDGIADTTDNCPTVANPGQTDTNNDGRGDVCPVYYVNSSAGANGIGTSWGTAFNTLQDALVYGHAGGGETWVAMGVYYPDVSLTGDSNEPLVSFVVPPKLQLLGGFAGNETSASQRNSWVNRTILSGDIHQDDTNTDSNNMAENASDIQGDNSQHVVKTYVVDSDTLIDGFFVTGGDASGDESSGGGWLNQGGSQSVSHAYFIGNRASDSGAGFLSTSGNPTFVNAAFTGNTADSGGALANTVGAMTLVNTTVSGNTGGAVKSDSGSLGLYNTILWGDTGGELSLTGGASATVTNSIVQGSGGSTSWNASFGTDNGGNLDANPMLLDPERGSVSLAASTSAALNVGDNTLVTQATDLGNQPRIQDTLVEIGALEYHAVPQTSATTLSGGATSDILTAKTANSFVNAGSGDDVVISASGKQVMTLGAGRDTVIWSYVIDADVVTDFVPGEDWLDVRKVLQAAGHPGANPLTGGYFSCTDTTGGAYLKFDRDGSAGSVYTPVNYALVKGNGVNAATLCQTYNLLY